MTAREALQRIAERALAQRDSQGLGAALVFDPLDKLDHDRSQLLVSGKVQNGRVIK